jgi:histone chaperone ASF1
MADDNELAGMALVQLREVELMNENPAPFDHPLAWRFKLELLKALPLSVDIAFYYVGDTGNDQHDQLIDEIEVGPLPAGESEFTFECPGPDLLRIPPASLLGMTGFYLMFAYAGTQFLRVGYFVNVAYWDDALNLNPPATVASIDMVGRNILMQRPMMSMMACDWDAVVARGSEGRVRHDDQIDSDTEA